MAVDIDRASWLVKETKGAALSCLVYLLLTRRPIGVVELARRVGWSRWKVSEGLAVLEGLKLAVSTGRTGSWQLTDQGYQLTLAEGENITIGGSSSLDSTLLTEGTEGKETELQQPARVKKSPSRVELAPEAEAVAVFMSERCSVKLAVARRTVARALRKQDRTPLRVKYDLIRWWAYAVSPKGEGIKDVGYFVAARIGDLVPPPSWFDVKYDVQLELDRLEVEMGKEGGAGWL